MDFKEKELIKSPLNYTGGKFKLLPQILPYFPNNIDTFVDLFTGGCNVGINVKANKIICNDIESVVIDLFNSWNELNSSEALSILKETIQKYNLSKTNEEGFKRIREDYNNGNRTWDMFYAMLTHAFNYQIEFTKKGNYSVPLGRNRSHFNPNMEKNFIKFIDKLKQLNICFANKDFNELKVDNLKQNDFIYCDPPYLITCTAYGRSKSKGWNEDKEKELYELLDKINSKGVRFALSNVFENKGKSNDLLKEWSKKYVVNYLNNSYSNCSYQAKDKSEGTTIEVLITNYKIN